MTLNDFKHKLKIQIRYKDVDKQGHVNNANHITYFETARVDYFFEVFKDKIDWIKTGMILARTEINYIEPIFLEDSAFCYTKITAFGTKSFDITNIITKFKNGTEVLCAEGKSVMVCFNYELNQTIEIPQDWKNAVEAFEGK